MPLFSRRPRGPVPLPAPRLDGSGWPDPAVVGRPSFGASALHELALRDAYEIEAHAVADRLVDELLPRLPTGATAEDEPYVRKVVLTAARVGAGLGRGARGTTGLGPDEVDRETAGALLLARAGLPTMPPRQAAVVGWFLLAAFRTARLGPDEADRLAATVEVPPA